MQARAASACVAAVHAALGDLRRGDLAIAVAMPASAFSLRDVLQHARRCRAPRSRGRCPRPSCRRRGCRPCAGFQRGTPFGRDLPDLIAFRSKKNALIMFFAVWPTMILASLRLSMRSAVSKSTSAPSTIASRIASAPDRGRASSARASPARPTSAGGDLRARRRAARHPVVLARPTAAARRDGRRSRPAPRAQLVGASAPGRRPSRARAPRAGRTACLRAGRAAPPSGRAGAPSW